MRDHDSDDARRALGGLYYIDDRFADAQHQWEIAFRKFRERFLRPVLLRRARRLDGRRAADLARTG